MCWAISRASIQVPTFNICGNCGVMRSRSNNKTNRRVRIANCSTYCASSIAKRRQDMKNDELHIGLVSISDRASSGVYEDKGIPALEAWFVSALISPWRIETRLIPDEQPVIEQTLIELCDKVGCHLVLTTGGTGPALRDVTPEATLAVG